MILRSLSLENFRNFEERKFEFASETTLVIGANTSGKTSLLEAIYLLSGSESFRAERVEEMIKFGGEIARVKGKVGQVEQVGQVELEGVLTRGLINGKRVAKKRYLVNGVSRKRDKFTGNFFSVIFRPEEIDLIAGAPSLRRDYLDEVLSQVDRDYQRSILSYKKGIRARNKLLEKARGEPRLRQSLASQLYFWDKLLVKNGQLICQKRETYLEFVSRSLGEKADLQVEYQKNVITQRRLEEWREREIAIGMTMIGPQRDDFEIKATRNGQHVTRGGRNLAVYGSRGEHRLAVLYLKMAQLEYILERTDQKPVLLLDDIFAELDENFRKEVMKLIDKQQTIVTGIELEGIRIKGAEVIGLNKS